MLAVVKIFEDTLEVGTAVCCKDWDTAYNVVNDFIAELRGTALTTDELEKYHETDFYHHKDTEPGKSWAVQVVVLE